MLRTFVSPARVLPRAGAALAAVLLLGAATRASEITVNLTGKVAAITPSGQTPDVASKLADLGVEVGADITAQIVYESTTPGYEVPAPDYVFMQYDMAITHIALACGEWEAHFAPPPGFETLNFVQVADDTKKPVNFDSWSAVALGVDTDLILSDGPFTDYGNFFYGFTQVPPKASSDEGLVQDLAKYKSSRIGTFGGPGGVITVTFDGQGGGGTQPPPDPTALARKGQLRAAAWLGGKLLKGLGKLAGKPPEADPLGTLEVALLQDCEDTFGEKFLAAVDKALKKGGSAPLPASGKEAAAELLMAGLLAQFEALGTGADETDPHDRTLRSKLLKAAGAQASADFGAYATHAKKPDPAKLEKALAKSREKLIKAFEKALDKAEAQGVSYAGPSATEVSDALVALVVAFDDLTHGP